MATAHHKNHQTKTQSCRSSRSCAESAPGWRREAAQPAIDALPPPDVTVWSDGSAKGGTANGGAGALVQLHSLGREVEVCTAAGAVCSSLRAELVAIREALAVITRASWLLLLLLLLQYCYYCRRE